MHEFAITQSIITSVLDTVAQEKVSGMVKSVNLTVGLATPPMGLVLFVASSVSGERVETIAKAILPFLAVEAIVIFLITYFPAISMTVPLLTGFAK